MIFDKNLNNNLLENLKYSKGNINKLPKKVSIIGCNNVGICCVVALIYSKLTINICLIDPYDKAKVIANVLDLEHCLPPGITLTSSSEIEDSSGSDVCVMCIDKSENDDENLINEDFEELEEPVTWETIQINTKEYNKIVPIIARKSPKTIFIVTTYPYSYMTYVTWKCSKFPINRVFGMGTIIETIHFKAKMANVFQVSTSNVNGLIIGAINYKIILWSEVTIGGTPLREINDDDGLQFYKIMNTIFKLRKKDYSNKGHPYFSIGAIAAKLVQAVVRDSREVYTVGTKNKGIYGMKHNVFLSLPAIIGSNGVHSIIIQRLSKFEVHKMNKASNNLYNKFYKNKFK